jgi:hypothetical protein
MNIVERARRLCLTPDTEWPVIAGESAPLAALLTGYVLPLAALSAIGSFVGAAMAGLGLMTWFVLLATSLLMSLVGVVVLSVVIDALAPTFGAQKSAVRAGNVAAYAPTAAWVAGIVQFVPVVGRLLAMLGALYTLYLLYLGLLRVMKSPPDKAAIYTIVVVVVALVIGFVVNVVAGALGLGAGLMPAYTLG